MNNKLTIKNMNKTLKKNSSFTLIELLVVIVIIG
ncbi:prepilin-type N-terminal cleavage/methylation domain-containing protein, partial [Patescibacteria group bacterium]|nr:prepilin-type N-terminal cleavage/methylation domain-containing protein [Patescibacteria group bacterium]